MTMKTLKALAVASLLGLAVAIAQVPIKIGSLTPLTAAPPNALFIITIPGVTNYVITAQNLALQISGGLSSNTVYISTNINNYSITTNLTVYQTNIVNNTITTNITVVQNIYVSGSNFLDTLVLTNALFQTNRTTTIPTNATVYAVDFKGAKDWHDCPVLYETNLFLYLTNVVAGREMWVFFGPTGPVGNTDITVTNVAGYTIHWVGAYGTNGNFAFTWTNGTVRELSILVRTNNIIDCIYAPGL